jgi:phosphoglycerol transferase MdoB-like AlkP superfamily enzyme
MTNTLSIAGNILLNSLFFHPILPLTLPIGTIGLILLYWINKYILLRRAKRPEELSGLLASFFANLLPWALFFQSLSMTLFYKVIFEDIYIKEEDRLGKSKITPAYIGLGVSLMILPTRLIFAFLFKNCEPL